MYRNLSHGLRTARIASRVFATLLILAVAAPLQASGVTNSSEQSRPSAELKFNAEVPPVSSLDDTIRVPIWIPGFDDVDPALFCSAIPASNLPAKKSSNPARYGKLSGLDACIRMLRMLPWISHPAPTGRMEYFLPKI